MEEISITKVASINNVNYTLKYVIDILNYVIYMLQ